VVGGSVVGSDVNTPTSAAIKPPFAGSEKSRPAFLFQPEILIQETDKFTDNAPNKPAPADDGNDGNRRKQYFHGLRFGGGNGKLLISHPKPHVIRPQSNMISM